jgi:predicted transcriptional regulator/transcriptional regulator with XRE-family HTH domain
VSVTQPRLGVRLRRLREERGLTQRALAAALGISPSYVNQMESNQRPVTAAVLLKLADALGVDIAQFAADAADRLCAQLRDVLADAALSEQVSEAEVRELAAAMPAVGRSLVDLHRRYRHNLEVTEALSARFDAPAPASAVVPPAPYEDVRDLFYAHRNYFHSLDAAAESIAAASAVADGSPLAGLTRRLRERHAITVTDLPEPEARTFKRCYDPGSRELALSPLLDDGQRAFQLAAHLAGIELAGHIDEIVTAAGLPGAETRELARTGLASYAAGATILPYQAFRDSSEATRYDIGLLQRRFRVSYETIAHRLSTLQRPRARGVPFFLVRVDRAGNISKRQSATNFHFSRVGGSCPLWNVYAAFAAPGRISRQLAQMPDGRSYLWIARTVTQRTGGFRDPAKTFAIGLGCDIRHAPRLVYADDLDLASPAALTPIGPGCKLCDRPACPQRAFPAIGKPVDTSTRHSRFAPYSAP